MPPKIVELHHIQTMVDHVVHQIQEEGMETPHEYTVLVGDRDRITLIFNSPGESTDPHWHLEFDEWWLVLAGKLAWATTEAPTHPTIDQGWDYNRDVVEEGQLIYVPRHFKHSITNVGDTPSCRMAIATPKAPHIWEKRWVGDDLDEFLPG